MSGSRNAGPVASAWAVINYLGYDGFLERILKVFDSMDLLTQAIDRIPGLQVHGQPQGVHFSFGSDEHDMIAIGDALMARGWMMNLQTKPESLLLMLSAQHNATVVNRYVSELTEVSAAVTDGSIGRQHNEQAYGIY